MQIPSLQSTESPEEWQLRVDLAACYRLVAFYGWADLVFTHISARVPALGAGLEHYFLLNGAARAARANEQHGRDGYVAGAVA